MGVAEAETLRRMNDHLGDFNSAIDRGTYIRTFLADERLVPRTGERFWPAPDRVEEAASAAARRSPTSREQGFDVIGDLDSLLVPDELPERRTPGVGHRRRGGRGRRRAGGAGCCTTYATCGTSAAACGASSTRRRGVPATRACGVALSLGARGSHRCCCADRRIDVR